MQGLEDHYFRFTSDELFNGLPAQLVDEWSAWGVKAAAKGGAEGYPRYSLNTYFFAKISLHFSTL